jgi:lipooligosaccharide transport system permease protein
MVTLTVLAGSRRASRVYERNVRVYRSSKLILASGVLEPLLYLGSVGLGFGHLVGSVSVGGHPVRYLDFVAPALLATSAMNGAIYDSTFNVFHNIKYSKVYDAVLATPVGALDIAAGEVAWSLTRGSIYAVSFLAVMAGLGTVHSWWALLALPAASLVGLCFAGLGIAATSFMRSWQDFDYIQLATLPMFLFSATFLPVDGVHPDRALAGAGNAALQRRRVAACLGRWRGRVVDGRSRGVSRRPRTGRGGRRGASAGTPTAAMRPVVGRVRIREQQRADRGHRR